MKAGITIPTPDNRALPECIISIERSKGYLEGVFIAGNHNNKQRLMIMSVIKHEIHNKGTMREQAPFSKQLIKGGLVLLMVVMFLISSFAIATSSALRITIGTFAPYYSPTFVRIATGVPISWDNPTADLHSITHDGCKTGERCAFDSGPLGHNGTFTVPHLPPGSYSYHCSFHPIMRGVLVVGDSSSSSET